MSDKLKEIQNVKWHQIRGVIFDMDGTLYRQGPVRMLMVLRLLAHVVSSRNGWRNLLVLRHYRQSREILAEACVPNISSVQFRATAETFGLPEELVVNIVHEWMEVKPLPYLKHSRFKDVENFFAELKKRGIKIGVFSDYPVAEKLKAIGLEADAMCCATEADVDRLKPQPAGLLKLINSLGVPPQACVMIGDRLERDGLCAANANTAFLMCRGTHFYTRHLHNLSRS